MPRKKTHEEFISEISRVNSDITILGTYISNSTYITVKCNKCDNVWDAQPNLLLRGHGCPVCAKNQKLIAEEFCRRVNEVLPDIKVLGKYTNSTSRIKVMCLGCGNEWSPIASSLLGGHGCKRCSSKALGIKYTLSQEEFEERVHKTNPNIQFLEKYKSAKENIRCRCTICGSEWNPRAGTLLRGGGCRQCSYNARGENLAMSEEDFLARVSQNKKITILGKYNGTKKTIRAKCNYCGNVWDADPKSLLIGRGCIKCSHSSTSYIEQLLFLIFSEIIGSENVLSRDRHEIGSELDIYIPSYKMAIEYGAWFWHKPNYKRDLIKVEKCKEKKIRLIRIYDCCFGDQKAKGEDVYLYDGSLSDDTEKFLVLVKELLSFIGLEWSIDNEKLDELSTKAYENSRRMTPEEFRKKAKEVNKDIEVVGDYISSKTKIKVKCKLCGREFKIAPVNLLQGQGCSICNHKRAGIERRFNTEEFSERLQQVSKDIQLLEPYTTSTTRIRAKCKICGHEWNPIANQLLQGRGCPVCRYVKSSSKRLDTNQTFSEKLRKVNPDIEVIGDYVKSNIKIKVKCKICGHEWEAKPNNLTQGSGCPICRRKQATEKRKMTMENKKGFQ